MPPRLPPRKPSKPDHLASQPAQPTPPPIPLSTKPKVMSKAIRNPKKRLLLWDWTSTRDNIPIAPFLSPLTHSVHNWNAWSPPDLPSTISFQPMLRVEAGLAGEDWAMINDNPHAVIHYLNEPERFQPAMSAARASQKWLEQMVPLRKTQKKKLVSPACASDPAGTQWLAEWMAAVLRANEPPDFLGLHYYGDDDGEGAIGYLTSMHDRWPTLPVIVSEIACISRDARQVEKFTAKVANWADMTPWIESCGFFGAMTACADGFVSPVAQLMDEKGAPTALGRRVVGESPMRE